MKQLLNDDVLYERLTTLLFTLLAPDELAVSMQTAESRRALRTLLIRSCVRSFVVSFVRRLSTMKTVACVYLHFFVFDSCWRFVRFGFLT
jgi:hypothetical protein